MIDLLPSTNSRKQTNALCYRLVLAYVGIALFSFSALVHAEVGVELRKSFAGNISFELAAASFLQNPTDLCDVSDQASASLSGNIPDDASIKAAYLYWNASTNGTSSTSTVTFNNQTVTDSSPYEATYTTGFWIFSTDHNYTAGVADVSHIVGSTGAQAKKTYSMSNLTINSGAPHCNTGIVVGGWALVVIYEDDSLPFQVTNIFDGLEIFYNSQVSLPISNFKVGSNPMGKQAHITWEGEMDLNGTGETLSFNNVALFDDDNPDGNQFNSISNIYSAQTLSLDVDAYDLDDRHLSAGDTSATAQYSSGGDMVLLSAEIISVSNIPVADLAVTATQPTGWQEGSTINKQFTITNNGPNNIPANSIEFSISSLNNLSLNGNIDSLSSNSNWDCGSGSSICTYIPALRSGWSDYITLPMQVSNNVNTANLSVNVTHENASLNGLPYDIFDNQALNNDLSLNIPVVLTAVEDLSASSKVPSNLNGDKLSPGDTLEYTITISDVNNLALSGITITDDLPASIIDYRITSSLPAGAINNNTAKTNTGANGTGYIDISNIDLPSGSDIEITIEVDIDPNAASNASLQNMATISFGGNNWVIDTGEITLQTADLAESTIEVTDLNAGLIEAGDTLEVTITLNDANNTSINDLISTLDIPSDIENFTITSLPTGSSDLSTSSQLNIQGISFASNETASITFTVDIKADALIGTSIQFFSNLILNTANWNISSTSLEVVDSTTPSSGNKQLYLNASNTLSRSPQSGNSVTITDESSETWTLSPALQKELTFNTTDILMELNLQGNRGNGNDTVTDMTFELRSLSGTLIASQSSTVTVPATSILSLSLAMTSNTSNEVTIAAGETLLFTISSSSSGSASQNGRRITVHESGTLNNTLKADGYSAIILNASTVINVDSIQVFSQAFSDTNGDYIDDSGASVISSSQPDTTLSVRAIISDPFGAFDISSANINIIKKDGSALLTNTLMNSIDDNSDDQSSPEKTFETTFNLLEENEITGGWTISVTGLEGSEGDVQHTLTRGFIISPFLPSITLNKRITVVSDPINGTVNPKAIPQAELTYTITAVNTGRGKSDLDSIILEDEIPENSELYISDLSCNNSDPEFTLINNNNGPVCFLTGIAPNESGLSLDFTSIKDVDDKVWFAKADRDFNYEPDNTTEYDSAIRFIRIKLDGELNNQTKGSTNEPKFGLTYKVKLQ